MPIPMKKAWRIWRNFMFLFLSLSRWTIYTIYYGNIFQRIAVLFLLPQLKTASSTRPCWTFWALRLLAFIPLQTQRQRLASLGKFRASRAKILVATDVASRGLDIPMVAVVINLGLPYDANSYVHRAGRTARAGRPGKVVSLMSEFDVPRVEAIEKRIGKQLQLLETKDLASEVPWRFI